MSHLLRADHIGLLIALAMMTIAYLQLNEVRKERVAAGEALTQAQNAQQSAETTSSELKNIENEVLGHKKSIETILDSARKDKSEIANIWSEAEKIKGQINDLNLIIKRAKKTIEEINETAEINFLLTKAKNDDRKAFKKILGLSTIEGPYKNLLENAINQIVIDIDPLYNIRMEPKVRWKYYNTSPSTATIADFDRVYWSLPIVFKPDLLSELWVQKRIDIKEKLKFLYTVIQKENSLRALHKACMLMNKEAKINKTILGISEYSLWWETNKMKYEN